MLLLRGSPAAGSAPRADRCTESDSNAPNTAGVCDKDGAKLVVRDDDREEVVRERLRAYEQQTAPVLALFKKSGIPYWDVPAAGVPPQAIATGIEALIRKERGEAA